MSYIDNTPIQLEEYLQEQQDSKLRSIVNTYCDGNMDKVAKIVTVSSRNTITLQQWGLVHTIANLDAAIGILADQEGEIERYRSFISWLREDTIRMGRN